MEENDEPEKRNDLIVSIEDNYDEPEKSNNELAA